MSRTKHHKKSPLKKNVAKEKAIDFVKQDKNQYWPAFPKNFSPGDISAIWDDWKKQITPKGYKEAFKAFKSGDTSNPEPLFLFLEEDLVFLGSGYEKTRVIRLLKKIKDISPYKRRIQTIILEKIVSPKSTRDFREYRKLAVRVCDSPFLKRIETIAFSPRSGKQAQNRARAILSTFSKNRIRPAEE